MVIRRAGTAEIFLDGKLIYQSAQTDSQIKRILGTPKHNNYNVFSFTDTSTHVISVRYTNVSDKTLHNAGLPAGFFLQIGNPENYIKKNIDNVKENLSFQMFFTALTLAFGLLHLILYLFSPGLKSNLYYAIYLFLSAAIHYRTHLHLEKII